MRRAALAFVVLTLGCETTPPPASLPPPTRATPAPSDSSATPTGSTDSTTPPPSSSRSDADDVAKANDFGWKLYKKLGKQPGNVMLSGTSLRGALGIAYLGARGTTATEMVDVLGLAPTASKAADAAKIESAAWQEAKGKAELVVASRLFADKESSLLPDVVKMIDETYGAPPQSVDFQKAPDDARKTINAWVSEKTSDKIHELFAKGAVDARSRFVITNAIYFKGRWGLPFAANETKDEPFKIDAKKSVTTKMMHATDSHRYAEGSGVKLLELGYQGSELSMVFVLPDDANALSKIEESLDDATLAKWTADLKPRRVAITLPRFAFKSGGSMNAALVELGMKTAFGPQADFTGMAGTLGIQLSQVAHQTWVALDEQGTEAAAATGVVMRATSLVMGPVSDFKADHPFLFVIRDSKRGRILFVGRVADPTAKGT